MVKTMICAHLSFIKHQCCQISVMRFIINKIKKQSAISPDFSSEESNVELESFSFFRPAEFCTLY